MKTKSVALALGLLSINSAFASSWNYASIGNDDAAYYFDAETVQKNPNKTVLVWIKYVQKTKADSDGSWSTANRWSLNCNKRTLQSLQASTYDRDGKFIKSYPKPTDESVVVPDSVGEAMLKIACDPTFPNDKSGKAYFKIYDNDPFAFTKLIVEHEQSKQDNAPK